VRCSQIHENLPMTFRAVRTQYALHARMMVEGMPICR
jgi:hypothetical protein